MKDLKQQLDQLRERVDAQEKGPKAGPGRRKRVQQTEKDSEPRNEEVCSGSEAGGQDQND